MGCCWHKGLHELHDEETGLAPPPTNVRKPSASDAIVKKKIEQALKTNVLTFRECGLKSLPPAATCGNFADLRTADLTDNKLSCLPEAIGEWGSLKNLLASKNSLKELPSSVGRLIYLERCEISDNVLESLPDLSALIHLRVLTLDSNRLGPMLPDVFTGMVALEELNLCNNSLQILPPSISSLVKLQRLKLADNQLEELPDTLNQLRNLSYLDAGHNRLSCVPKAFLEGAESLSELWLKGNPIDRLQLQKMPEFASFLERRKQRLDKKIGSGAGEVDLTLCGLD